MSFAVGLLTTEQDMVATAKNVKMMKRRVEWYINVDFFKYEDKL